jgi:hypothetical protein
MLSVRLTIWQFVAIVAALIVGYVIWTMWGQNLDQNGLIRKFNGGITDEDTSGVKTTKSGGGSSGGDSSGSETKRPW